MAGDYTDFWLACATAGPVLLIPTYDMVRRRRQQPQEPEARLGVTEGSVAFLGAGTMLALVKLAGGTPVRGGAVGRVIEVLLIGGPVISLALATLRGSPPKHRSRSESRP